MQKIDRFLKLMNDRGASDFHLTVGRPPMLRASGLMESIRYRTISETDFAEMMKPVTPPKMWEEFVQTNDVDFAYEIPGLARFRSNVFADRRGPGAVFRVIPSDIMTAEKLGLSQHILNGGLERHGQRVFETRDHEAQRCYRQSGPFAERFSCVLSHVTVPPALS